MQSQTRREDTFELIQAVVRQHMRHGINCTQIKDIRKLKNGKTMIEFTAGGPGSERDILFRSKSKLRGSGLFISESLTPRRQAMFF